MSATLSSFGFGQPWLLLLLLGVIPLWRWRNARGPRPAVTYSSHRLLEKVQRETRSQPRFSWKSIQILGFALLVVALARPRIERNAEEERTQGIDIMLVLDASRSMDSKDFDMAGKKVSRIEALHTVMGHFIKDRPRDRIGVIGFAEKPFMISPLTLDHAWMMESLQGVKTSLGTAIGSGVEAGVDLLMSSGRGTRIVILVTDGLNTSGLDPTESAAIARKFGVRLYTIGVVSYNEMQTEHLDGITLYKMAQMTGGKFFQAANGEALDSIYQEIDQLERTEFQQPRMHTYRELFAWFAAAALALLTFDLCRRFTWGMRLP